MIKLLLVILWFGLIPLGIGLGLTKNRREEADSFVMNLLLGYFTMFALFEILCVPMIFLGISFHVLCRAYGGVTLFLFVLSLIRNRKRLGSCTWQHLRSKRKFSPLLCLALLLIAVQIGMYVVGMATDLDDAFYVATAGTTIRTDGLMTHSPYTGRQLSTLSRRYAFSPFPILLAFFSQAVRLHPTVVAHTVMPVFFVSLAYGVCGLFGRRLFADDEGAVGLFLCFLSLLHMFSYYSVYTQGTFLLIRIWQGKAFLASVLLPAVFYLTWRFIDGERVGVSEWLALFFLETTCCLASGMGIILGAIMLGLLTVVLVLTNRRWRRVPPAALCCLTNMVCAALFLLWP